MTQMNSNDKSGHYPIVGRPDLDLSKYLVNVHGRDIIDYEKLKNNDPKLYAEILRAEYEANARDELEFKDL